VEAYLNAAIFMNPNALYHYFRAYVKFDYHHSKMLRAIPSYNQHLADARRMGITQKEKKELFKLLRTEQPAEF
jgi:hypothetical protein